MDSADEIPHHLLKEEYGIDTFPSISFSKENKLRYGNKSAILLLLLLLYSTGFYWKSLGYSGGLRSDIADPS